MRFTAFDKKGEALDTRVFYSIGGGFIIEEGESASCRSETPRALPFF